MGESLRALGRTGKDSFAYEQEELGEHQRDMHQLQLVSKLFKDVFSSNSGLIQRVYLGEGFSVTLLPSLLAWLRKRRSSVRALYSTCESQLLDVVLAALLSSEPSVEVVNVCTSGPCSVSILAMFTRLEKCYLFNDGETTLDLAPLGVLTRLSELALQGRFKELYRLTGLTKLETTEAEIWDVQELAPTLQCLVLRHSHLSGILTQGLSACTALTHLALFTARLVENSGHEYLDRDLTVFPADICIGLLTQLRTLSLCSASHSQVANVEWFSQLALLQDLSLIFCCSNKNLIQAASLLTKLTCLNVDGVSDNLSAAPVLNIDIEWSRLHALQDLCIRNFRLELGDGVAGLPKLQHLAKIDFVCTKVHDGRDKDLFASLLYQLSTLRPQLKLSVTPT